MTHTKHDTGRTAHTQGARHANTPGDVCTRESHLKRLPPVRLPERGLVNDDGLRTLRAALPFARVHGARVHSRRRHQNGRRHCTQRHKSHTGTNTKTPSRLENTRVCSAQRTTTAKQAHDAQQMLPISTGCRGRAGATTYAQYRTIRRHHAQHNTHTRAHIDRYPACQAATATAHTRTHTHTPPPPPPPTRGGTCTVTPTPTPSHPFSSNCKQSRTCTKNELSKLCIVTSVSRGPLRPKSTAA